MKVYPQRFNLFFALAMAAALVCGCQTDKKKEDPKKKNVASMLRVHLQATPNAVYPTVPVSLLRSNPVNVTIAHDPILTEANVVAARLIEAHGGFAVEIQFDGIATTLLEQHTAANPGLHFVIFGQWGDTIADSRWLAAPLITRRITNGQLVFTPDMDRTQADLFVHGLKNDAKILKKDVSQ